MNIAYANAECSGGGIYIYFGALDDGNYFLADDSYMEYVQFLDTDPSKVFDESLYPEWQNNHRIGDYSGQKAKDFLKDVLSWICDSRPSGNYNVTELESRLAKLS